MSSEFTLYSLASVYALWLHYVLVMALRKAQKAGTLSRAAYALGLPPLVVGVILDALVNIVVCTVVLSELPREWLVTDRLKRHKAAGGWRGKVAAWICEHLLNAFDPDGCHC